MNQIAYAANNAAAVAANNQTAYNFALPPSGFTCTSIQPTAGPSGTKIQLRITGQYDILALTSSTPYAWVLFGNAAQKSPAQILKDPQDVGTYSITVDAPPFLVTNWSTPANVPLTIVVESAADGNELARVGSAGSFTYTDVGGSVDSSPDEQPQQAITSQQRRSTTRTPPSHSHSHSHDTSNAPQQQHSPPSLTVRTSSTTSPTTTHHQHHVDAAAATNTYGYPPAQQGPSSFGGSTVSAYSQNSNDTMLHAYRTSNNYAAAHQQPATAHHYHHRSPTSLRSPHHGLGGWDTYGGLAGRTATYTAAHHTAVTRPSLTPSLPMPSGGPPALVRTTTLGQGNPSMGLGGAYNAFTANHKAVLHIQGNLESMAVQWNKEEWDNRRRIVMFNKKQVDNRLTATFRAVPVNERPPNQIYISCIWWEEKQECYVTSVDTIHLLEQLVAAPARFTVEEKNRIRRNLEGFKPLTVSKAKAESEDFFKVIMGFGAPKPRNIEKDVKVFPWKVLATALKKIISKYSASPSSTVPQSTHHHPSLLTPVSVGSTYGLPPTPTTATDPSSATGYMAHHGSLSESIPSPRSLTGGMHSSWATATAYQPTGREVVSSRAMSPSGVLKTTASPTTLGRGLAAIPAYDTRTPSTGYGLPTHGSGHLGQGQGQAATAGRWDYSVNTGYDYGAYGDGASQRA